MARVGVTYREYKNPRQALARPLHSLREKVVQADIAMYYPLDLPDNPGRGAGALRADVE